MWEKREEEWQREKAARDHLMNEVLAVRQRQIQEKMELNRRAQEESIRYREQLIKELEEAKELTRREKEQEKELKTAWRQELEAQVPCAPETFPDAEGARAMSGLTETTLFSLCPADRTALARAGGAAAPEGGGRGGEISPAALPGAGAAGGQVHGGAGLSPQGR
uniref:Trichoplein keratin filament-binding protein n=1 Tax=Amazona collaria TaxID=241587 RepID=A0A8B9FSA8_9PSIT